MDKKVVTSCALARMDFRLSEILLGKIDSYAATEGITNRTVATLELVRKGLDFHALILEGLIQHKITAYSTKFKASERMEMRVPKVLMDKIDSYISNNEGINNRTVAVLDLIQKGLEFDQHIKDRKITILKESSK